MILLPMRKIFLANKKKMAVGILAFLLLTAVFLFYANTPVKAAANNMLWGGQMSNFQKATGLGSTDPRVVAAKIIQIFLGFLGIIALLLILYAGFLWMTSGGDDQKISQAKKILTNVAIGLAIILLSFAIVTFILNSLLGATTGTNGTPTIPVNSNFGISALGGCSVASVYPEPGQGEVPRNTSIVVTFKEEVEPTTMCGNAICNGTQSIKPNNIRIYKTTAGDSCPTNSCNDNILKVSVATNDNKTFVLTPLDYLGSPSEFIYYTVHLTNDIRKKGINQGIFTDCRSDSFEWQFQVSNLLDLTPPQILSGGIFPPPDTAKDTSATTAAVAAQGHILVTGVPRAYSAAGIGNINANPQGVSPNATVAVDPQCAASGNFQVTVLNDGQTAQLAQSTVLLGSAVFAADKRHVTFPNYFTLTLLVDVGAGNSWLINGISAEVKADTLGIGNTLYTFVKSAPGTNEIQAGSDAVTSAANIASALAGNADVAAVNIGAQVNLTAKVAGQAGNNFALVTNSGAPLALTALSGGTDMAVAVTVNGVRDKPKNSVVQINFNEAINPLTVSGPANTVNNYMRIVNADSSNGNGTPCSADNDCASFSCVATKCAGDFLDGKFMIANQYRTVEFVSNNLCGVNACGQKIYCLPADGHLSVQIMAADLAPCTNCAAKTPFNSCNPNNHCYDSTNNKNYPTANIPPNGVVDMAMNSLDGNRDGNADGPASAVDYYDENTASGPGDNFTWSFFINDILDLTPPKIKQTVPAHKDANINLADPLSIDFDKLMMMSSLGTGKVIINNGQKNIEHELINLRSLNNNGVGYWTAGQNIDDNLDSEPDWTKVEIRHSLFSDSTSFRAQAGSGIEDIYQNCFNPSSGNGCTGKPSCCGLTPTAAGSCP